ncbi:TonB-dependent receptor [Ursidibacter maritimus]|uniref:TonB-dependent receptor n=1 Tax=Ursidibacter maritimus TaxID=1331689 RepID=A0A949T4T7_9PAST|nr:TonB-dependent receptor plug domain-containing protein [Ursidibacter maritimus]KAE9542087.1 hypothetical protein A1D26_07860 [Ursidibacter maritimus]MBV6524136.1 TonB-dependent receptor [Ursidibacter maritimus]MBV6525226.1 TonB-dependent receptor [Ursidibacter maritimus]MBV6527538.1 TonB-dependent receptor [Ursidibacter maritimus]MBV6529903.1 TonB-dependent receptor [Ursidibacter maritimus]
MKINKISLAIMLSCHSVYASEQLEQVNVLAQDSVGYHLGRAALEKISVTDKSINHILLKSPLVRGASEANNSLTQGEISPPNITFYGEKYYNNNFLINGISTNDNVNPIGLGNQSVLPRARTLTVDPESIPTGHPQLFWVSPDLIQSVEVLDSNIPSRYGQFTGGVVEAELLEPDFKRHSGKISYRTTRDSWTKFHIDGQLRESFNKAEYPLFQPKFTKHQYHIQVNQPLSNSSALLFAYDRQDSFIPQHQRYLKQTNKQKRRNETFLLSYKNELNGNNVLLTNLMYSPHIGDYYLDNVKNGAFRESGGGWLASLRWKNYNQLGLLTTDLSYRTTKNQTAYDAQHLSNYYVTPSINWLSEPDPDNDEFNTAREGGIGKKFTQQKQIQFKQSLDLHKWQTAQLEHNLSLGWEYQYNQSQLRQPNLSVQRTYSHYLMGERFTQKQCDECIPGEQYVVSRTFYYPVTGKVDHNRVALYLQNRMKWHNFTLTPGVRAEYGQFMEKWNIAPRIALNYDVLGLGKTYISTGFNRYYADDLLDYQLRSSFKFKGEEERRLDFSGWDYKTNQFTTNYRGSTLKTPYSDEVNVGITHRFNNAILEAKWVQRSSKKQFVTKREDNLLLLTNSGYGKTNNISLQVSNPEVIKLPSVELGWKIGVSYQKTKSNQTIDYTQSDWSNFGITKMIYKGKLRDIDQMPSQSFNDPWRASLQLNSYFPALNLSWLQQLNYESGSRYYERKGARCSAVNSECAGYEGLVVKLSEIKQSRNITLDWTFSWKKAMSQHQAISMDLSVFNVLNRVSKANIVDDGSGGSYQTYKPGRQFWLGAKYEW